MYSVCNARLSEGNLLGLADIFEALRLREGEELLGLGEIERRVADLQARRDGERHWI